MPKSVLEEDDILRKIMRETEWRVIVIATSHCLIHSMYANMAPCLELCLHKKCVMEVTNTIRTLIIFKAFVM